MKAKKSKRAKRHVLTTIPTYICLMGPLPMMGEIITEVLRFRYKAVLMSVIPRLAVSQYASSPPCVYGTRVDSYAAKACKIPVLSWKSAARLCWVYKLFFQMLIQTITVHVHLICSYILQEPAAMPAQSYGTPLCCWLPQCSL